MKRAIILLLTIFLMSGKCFAALDAAIVWEVRTTGAQNSGGGYKTGATGTDYSQQDAPQWANEAVTSAGAGTTMLTANAAATMVGNVLYVVSGTNATVGWYEIASVSAGVSITTDRNWCTGAVANGVCNIGGAWLLGGTLDDDFFEQIEAGNTVYIKSGSYTTGEEVSSSAGDGTADNPVFIYGYNSTRGDWPSGDNRPLITMGSTWRWLSADYWWTHNLQFSGANATGIVVAPGNYGKIYNCKVTHTAGSTNSGVAISMGIHSAAIGCEAINVSTSSTSYGFSTTNQGVHYIACVARDCYNGFKIYSGASLIDCIVESCVNGAIHVGFAGSQGTLLSGSTFRGCGTGFNRPDGYHSATVLNCIFEGNTIGVGGSGDSIENTLLDYNLWWNNGTDVSTGGVKGIHAVNADPGFTAAVVEGTDGATDGAGTVFTAASAPFSGVDTGDTLVIVEAGTGATLGVYTISSVDSTSQLTLDSSAGASKTGVDYKVHKDADFTKSSNAGGNGNGLGPQVWTDATDDGGTDIGGQNEAAAASGGGVNKSGNKQ